jgi:DTW domain-containing protein YfiP
MSEVAVDLAAFMKKREEQRQNGPTYRNRCRTCWQPDFSCYCAWLRPIDPGIDFVILIHPLEHKKRIATGRMSHLSLRGSRLFRGIDFSNSDAINLMLADPARQCVLLYPGKLSINLTHLPVERRCDWLTKGKRPTLIVMDGSWNTVAKMVRLSRNLKALPRICFTPSSPSNFRVRRQPDRGCYSTIEAIHHIIELLGPACGFSTLSREHDRLLEVFDKMIDRTIELTHSLTARATQAFATSVLRD